MGSAGGSRRNQTGHEAMVKLKIDGIPNDVMFSRPVKSSDNHALNVVIEGRFAYSVGHHDALEFASMASELSGRYYDHAAVSWRWVSVSPVMRYSRKKRKTVPSKTRVMLTDCKPDHKGAIPITCCDEAYAQ